MSAASTGASRSSWASLRPVTRREATPPKGSELTQARVSHASSHSVQVMKPWGAPQLGQAQA